MKMPSGMLLGIVFLTFLCNQQVEQIIFVWPLFIFIFLVAAANQKRI